MRRLQCFVSTAAVQCDGSASGASIYLRAQIPDESRIAEHAVDPRPQSLRRPCVKLRRAPLITSSQKNKAFRPTSKHTLQSILRRRLLENYVIYRIRMLSGSLRARGEV